MQPIPAPSTAAAIVSEQTDEEKSQGAKTPPALSAIFTLVHTAENTVPYPNKEQAEKERDHRLSNKSDKQNTNDIDDQIKQEERDRRQERKTLGITSVQDFTDQINKIKNTQTEPRPKFTNSSNPSHLSQQAIHIDSDESEIVGSLSASDEDLSSEIEEDLDKLNQHLSEWENELNKNRHDLITKTRANANKEDIAQCQKEVDDLETDIAQLRQILSITSQAIEHRNNIDGQQEPAVPHSPAGPAKGSVQQMLQRTKTGHRRPDIPKEKENAVPSGGNTSTTPSPYHASSERNSALFSRSDLDSFFTDEAKKTLGTMNEKIQAVAESIDMLLKQRGDIKKNKSGPQPDAEILKIDEKIKKSVLKLSRLINRVTLIEALVSPAHELSSEKKKKEKYDAIIQKYQSDQTNNLNNIYQQKKAAYEHSVLNSRGTNAISLLAGAVTNFSSFFWGNSLARLLGSGLPTAASYMGGALSGLLHVVIGGPVLKQVASATWDAPALVEFNTYWKVAGSLWGDRFRATLGKLGVDRWVDENHKKKYLHADASKPGYIDIEQRWQETRGLWPLLKARYKTEEAAYFSYAMNFTFKAASAGGMASLMASKSDASKVIEWFLHSVMGWFSGAQTVAGIQRARSPVPGAEEKVSPSREVHAAYAAMLQSLLSDLQAAYQNLRTQSPPPTDNRSERDLLKAIRRTQKSLNEANTKSHLGGTFWFEFLAQFKTVDARADAAAEVLGRALSVMPSAALSNYLASWRVSGNPWLTFGGHALPALLLIVPPGWTARPLCAGFFRALFQMVINETSPKVNNASSRTTATTIKVPDNLHDSIVEGSESSSYLGSEFSEKSGKNANADEDESVIVRVSDGEQTSDDEDSDEEAWKGRPTRRNQDNFWS
jgi:hypothetical protein